MKLRKLKDPYREALAHFEALRRLGFEADEIFMQAGPAPAELPIAPGTLMAQVILRTQGKEFRITVGWLPETEDFRTNMLAVVRELPKWKLGDLDRFVWKKSKIGRNAAMFIDLVAAMLARGIICPAAPPPSGLLGPAN